MRERKALRGARRQSRAAALWTYLHARQGLQKGTKPLTALFFFRVSFYVSFSSLHYKLIFIQLDLLKSGSPDVARDEKERHTFLQLVNKIFSGLSVL